MRAVDLVSEKVNPETVRSGFRDQETANNNQWIIRAEGQEKTYGTHTANVLHVQVVTNDEQRKELAWAKFLVKQRKEDGEKYLESTYTFVSPKHRGQGLAKLMYQYANSLGNDIRPSELQTDMGRGMWQGLSKSVKQPAELPKKEPKVKPTLWNRFRQALAEINDDDELSVSQQIQDYFINRGYGYLGEGRDQIAFLSPRGTVVKVVGIGEDEREDVVKTYVGFFMRNQRNPHYPRIYNAGDFSVDGETYFVYEMEYLYPVSGEEQVLEYIEDLMGSINYSGQRGLDAFRKNRPLPPGLSEEQVDGLVFATQDLEDAIGGQAPLDLRSIENLGRRKDGQIVIIDPFSL